MALVLGIDGGFAAVGWAVLRVGDADELVATGVIRTEKSAKKLDVRASDDNLRRAQDIAAGLGNLCRLYKPELLCMEAFSYPRSSGVAAKMGMGFGVIAGLAYDLGVGVLQASPQDVKKALTGKKNATKEEIQMVVEARFPEIEWPKQTTLWEHVGDAVAVVLACKDSNAMKMARRMSASSPEGKP